MRICYYDLLGIDKLAEATEIKKAYRKQALIWHPDKNGDRVEEATERFALIHEAYEVLSDPQERSWYDGHRDSILRGTQGQGQRDSSAGTATEDLMQYFSVSEFKGYEDTPKGFYNVYGKLFQKLANEEEEAFRNNPPENDDEVHSATSYPSFGHAQTPFTDQDGYLGYGAYVKDFYGAWSNFSSIKPFLWMDKWRLSDAPNRYVRRQMEKENKKIRETARKEYNETIRRLAEFVRKRDPRVAQYLAEEQKRKEASAAEQKARIQREKEELRAKVAEYEAPAWAQVEQELDSEQDEEDEDEDEEILNEYYCVVCDKAYKTERQLVSHESSKRHLENVELLKEEMLADEMQFGSVEALENLELEDKEEQVGEEKEDLEEQLKMLEESIGKKKKKNKKNKAPRWGYDEEDVPETVEDLSALTAALEEEQSKRRKNKADVECSVSVEKESAKAKREKRKEKKKQKEEASIEFQCNVCADRFETRNALFAHIKETGHALAAESGKSGKKGKRK